MSGTGAEHRPPSGNCARCFHRTSCSANSSAADRGCWSWWCAPTGPRRPSSRCRWTRTPTCCGCPRRTVRPVGGSRWSPCCGPWRTTPHRGETLWLVPDGPLHDLPLHAVEVDGTPLGERNPLCVTPSASLLRHRLGQAPDAGVRRALIMADPVGDLPHARAEAHLIGGLLPDVEVYTGASATRRRLLGG
ncbi:CHAT domain-containing protein [Streptomyces zaomyceticus]|uniref:CHAT domain-containing protein n=1 Tax=Streptomyces zaomyceticus TaxID=68286 RepID=UPI00324DCCB7